MTPRSDLRRIAISAVVFDVVWGVSALLAGRGHWAAGAGVAVFGGAVHAWLARADRRLLIRVLMVAAVGTSIDLALIRLGVFHFAVAAPLAAAVWFAGLWLHFAPSVALLFRWLAPRLWLAALLGAAAGPFAYWVAERLGAVRLEAAWSLPVIACAWAILFPFSVRMLVLTPGAARGTASAGPDTGAPR